VNALALANTVGEAPPDRGPSGANLALHWVPENFGMLQKKNAGGTKNGVL